ncbi:MAG: OmpP1/FadL family transporter [Aeromonas sp.]|uniref:OmpP1/FadL family transporter n=1 Tax=Aeromonas sp. TaxID=647 RepID=UPI003F3F9D43
MTSLAARSPLMPRLVLPLTLFAAQGQAGGLYLYETGTDDLGLATAGMAARAQDPGVQLMNPAGLSHLEGRQLTVGGQLLYGDAPYDLDDPALSDVDTVIGWFPAASFYYSQQLDERWSFGVATYGNFGLGLDYGDWAGKELLKEATLLALTLQPSLAYRIDEHWSLGAALGINYGLFALKRDTGQGEQKQDDSDWALNGKLGLLYEFNPDTRIGLGYTSEVKYHFNIEREFPLPDLPGTSAHLSLTGLVNSPQQLMLSAYHQLSHDWAIMGNLGWQDWSQYNSNEITLPGRVITDKGMYKDTYHLAVGVQHALTPQWTLNGGIAYDSSAYEDQQNTSLTVPSGSAVRLGTGASYAFNPQDSLGMGFEYLHMDGSSVALGDLSGHYPDPDFYFFAVNYHRRF